MNIIKFLIFTCFFFWFSLSANAQRVNRATDSVYVRGSIYNNHDHVRDASINIYDRNELIKSVNVKTSNRFVANLPINKFLTIEIVAPDFHTKRFIFDTTLPTEVKEAPEYDFDMDIFSEEELAGVNTSLLDFPIGLVSYNEKKGKFLRNKNYTKKMKKRYLELLDEAMMTERAAQ